MFCSVLFGYLIVLVKQNSTYVYICHHYVSLQGQYDCFNLQNVTLDTAEVFIVIGFQTCEHKTTAATETGQSVNGDHQRH